MAFDLRRISVFNVVQQRVNVRFKKNQRIYLLLTYVGVAVAVAVAYVLGVAGKG